MSFRVEKDTMGEVHVPDERYWGAQTQRSMVRFLRRLSPFPTIFLKENFKIGGHKMPIEIIRAMAILKKASARSNVVLANFSAEKALAICDACDEVISGKHDSEFPLVVWQTGSGTQTNMNVNEVVSNRATELMGGDFRSHKLVSANDDVNKSQSSNDTFPTAMHIAVYTKLVNETIPNVQRLQGALSQKADLFSRIVKIGRTHMMDATPLTLGQV
jgi:fumarate hydratase, class II